MTHFEVKTAKDVSYPLRIPDGIVVKQDDLVLVKTERGEEALRAYVVPTCVCKIKEKHKPETLTVIRVLTEEDKVVLADLEREEKEAFKIFVELSRKLNLVMTPVKCSYTFDKAKVTFYYTAPERVDFRALLKELTAVMKHVRIDLRHIGVRDETAMCKGNGICGRPYCCCTFKRKFESVTIKLARDQGMPVTPGKVSGTCGRLLCCLNYEYKDYVEAAKEMPSVGSGVMTVDGPGRVAAVNFLNEKVTVKLQDEKLKDFSKSDIEIIDADLNIKIDAPRRFDVGGEMTSEE